MTLLTENGTAHLRSDRHHHLPPLIALPAPEVALQRHNRLVGLPHPCRSEHQRRERLRVAADALDLDQITRPEISEPSRIERLHPKFAGYRRLYREVWPKGSLS